MREIFRRKQLRLKWYDYSNEWLYFITICINKNLCLLGDITGDIHHIFESWKMIETYWLELEQEYQNIELHEYIVMPNHFHGIIEISWSHEQCDCKVCRGAPCGYPEEVICPYNKQTLWNIIWSFKSKTTNKYIKNVQNNNWEPFYKKLWQRNYYEHIIRDESGYLKISQYIRDNSKNWKTDKLYITQV